MKSTGPHYMPQLDSLRAFAVFAVMLHHWSPEFLGFGPWGDLGVRCFFVLSGFLITGILLRGRDLMDSGRSTLGFQLRQFYIRRSLRIFPIYYLTLAAGVMLGMYVLKDTVWWHASYTSNIYFALRGEWRGYVSHLWSLSVEEQFYLAWPLLILALPRRRLPVVFWMCNAAAIFTRASLAMGLGPDHLALKVLLPCNLDSLVIGALLAWTFASGLTEEGAKKVWFQRGFAISAVAFVIVVALQQFGMGRPFLAVVGPTVESIFFAGVIGNCAWGVSGRLGRLLDLSPLQYFGRISYGLYLYHMFAGYMATMFANKLGLALPEDGVARFGVLFVLSFVAASVSYRFIETPFNQLKRFFPADGAKRSAERQAHETLLFQNSSKSAA